MASWILGRGAVTFSLDICRLAVDAKRILGFWLAVAVVVLGSAVVAVAVAIYRLVVVARLVGVVGVAVVAVAVAILALLVGDRV